VYSTALSNAPTPPLWCLLRLPHTTLPAQSVYMSGKPAQLEFMARNYRALSHKYALHQDFLSHFEPERAVAAHAAIKSAAAHNCKSSNHTLCFLLFSGVYDGLMWLKRWLRTPPSSQRRHIPARRDAVVAPVRE
jgi:hypothetical protein